MACQHVAEQSGCPKTVDTPFSVAFEKTNFIVIDSSPAGSGVGDIANPSECPKLPPDVTHTLVQSYTEDKDLSPASFGFEAAGKLVSSTKQNVILTHTPMYAIVCDKPKEAKVHSYYLWDSVRVHAAATHSCVTTA